MYLPCPFILIYDGFDNGCVLRGDRLHNSSINSDKQILFCTLREWFTEISVDRWIIIFRESKFIKVFGIQNRALRGLRILNASLNSLKIWTGINSFKSCVKFSLRLMSVSCGLRLIKWLELRWSQSLWVESILVSNTVKVKHVQPIHCS